MLVWMDIALDKQVASYLAASATICMNVPLMGKSWIKFEGALSSL